MACMRDREKDNRTQKAHQYFREYLDRQPKVFTSETLREAYREAIRRVREEERDV